MAMGVEKHWQQERDDNERHARQTLQNLATSLVTDYKVSLLPACLPAEYWVRGQTSRPVQTSSRQRPGIRHDPMTTELAGCLKGGQARGVPG